jgi:hypothetical protein
MLTLVDGRSVVAALSLLKEVDCENERVIGIASIHVRNAKETDISNFTTIAFRFIGTE